jgi:site-specific DNA-methyltransferase (adenine-specific)
VVTDPPYGLAFMGKRWDYDVPSVEVWAECLRVLKPGGHLLAFAGTRTQHRMAVRIEDAGFEIRDMIAWVYGSGFPKSLDVSKAIDKAAGVEREVVGISSTMNQKDSVSLKASKAHPEFGDRIPVTAPATPEAQQWAGWGTALKPALEPITMARKPLTGTVAANVLEHGTGALNVDGCRVGRGTDDVSG